MALVGVRGVTRMDTATTPGRLRALLVLLVLLSLAWGALAAFTAYQHASAASDVVATSEPLSLDAEQIYQNLSDADDTAAGAFLAGGLEPDSARSRYNGDISQAATSIEKASSSTVSRDDLAALTTGLPVYTGEVATAQADNRLGLPLGAAYLREASQSLRGQLLAAASDIYTKENAQLTSESAQATGLPLMIVAVLGGLVSCYLLIRSARWLARRTHRMINLGLLAAIVASVVSLVWLASAYAVGRTELLHAQQHGSALVETFARADVAALRAHADESLTLIDNTGDDAYQSDFRTQQKNLSTLLAAEPSAHQALKDATAWFSAHAALRTLDDNGDHAAAVASARTGAAATAFARLSADLTNGIAADQAVFGSSARSGRDAFTGLAIGMLVAAAVMLAGATTGLTRRLAEYR